jgi:PiT family inorganic phosphate transporter
MLALRVMINDIGTEMAQFKELAKVPREQVRNFRNDMYVVSEAIRLMQKSGKPTFTPPDVAVLKNYKVHIDKATRFIPLWVKVAVALALGLGTMVGWKRIVVTVGEKIGKNHLTYAQGAAAEITAMATIGAADGLGLPVSTTHVLSSGVAGTMMANSSGLQWGTVRNLLLAWVLTLPAAMTLSGFLFFAFRQFVFRG